MQEVYTLEVPTPEESRRRIGLLVTALRSGEYAQICGTLGSVSADGVTRHCGLGVAIEVAIANGLDIVERVMPPGSTGGMIYYRNNEYVSVDMLYYSSMPTIVGEWYGFDQPWSGSIHVNGHDLEWWNDTRGLSFAEMADMIEAEYLPALVGASSE